VSADAQACPARGRHPSARRVPPQT